LLLHAAKDIEHGVKRNSLSPIYQAHGEKFTIDSCEPQFRAIREGKIEMHALSKGHYPGRRMNSNVLPGLSTIGFWDCRSAQDWGLDPHRNEGLEVVFLETGRTGFEVDGVSHTLQAGNLTITRPWQLHRLGDPHIGRGRLCWLILDVGVRRPNQEWAWPSWLVLAPKDLAELTRKLRYSQQSVWMTHPRMRQVFEELADCIRHWKQPRVSSRMAVAINRLLVELSELVAAQQVDEKPEFAMRRHTVELFLRDLAENPLSCGEPWTIASMAERCGMGVTSLSKYSRELVNNGPVAYLGLCRLEHAARELIANRRCSVTEVAMAAGFNTSQYFATAFQRRFGMTPGEYRRQAR
jgi:AraC-like DNA-binding protein